VLSDRRRTKLPQVMTFILGVGFTVNGIVGFAITGLGGFTAAVGTDLIGFNINPLHNTVHLVIGLIGLLSCWAPGAARAFGWLLVVGYGSVMAFGIFAVDEPALNVLALNAADNVLHGVTAFLGLIIALWTTERVAPAHTRPAALPSGPRHRG
jgi:hypothetical protein